MPMTAATIASWMKKNGWALNLLFILLGAYFLAGAANSVVARAIRIVPGASASAGVPSRGARTSAHQSHTDYVSIASRNLFGAKRENLSPVIEAPVGDSQDLVSGSDYDPNDLRKCTLAASLRATLVAEDTPEWSMAVVYNNGDRETGVYSINEGTNRIADDATLVEIRSREIVVRRRDHFELCQAEGEGENAPKTAARKAPTRKAPTPASTGPDDGSIQKTGATEWSIERDFLEKDVLGNLSKVATQARIVPSFKHGKPNGFKLFSIKPKSLFSKIGLQNGDVINKINGYEMNSPDKALEIYQKLRDASSVTVELTRRGQSSTHSYAIR